MGEKYRNKSFSRNEMLVIANSIDILRAVSLVTNVIPFNKMTPDEYRNWLTLWKSTYSAVSDTIRNIKSASHGFNTQSEQHRAHDTMKYIANTLLNARVSARNQRRLMWESHK